MFAMRFYCTREADGTIHVQNAVDGMLGRHHVHTSEDFESWRGTGEGRIADAGIKWMKDVNPCDCGLKAGEVRDGRGI